jgi:alpha-tubulin suppressor-like RCC1 family protein
MTPLSKCKVIEAGANHIGILNNDGDLFMWGSNSTGRPGRSDLNAAKRGHQRKLIAVDLPNGKKISSFSFGHSVAACDVEELYVWGSSSLAMLGLGDIRSCFVSHTAFGDSGELYVMG